MTLKENGEKVEKLIERIRHGTEYGTLVVNRMSAPVHDEYTVQNHDDGSTTVTGFKTNHGTELDVLARNWRRISQEFLRQTRDI